MTFTAPVDRLLEEDALITIVKSDGVVDETDYGGMNISLADVNRDSANNTVDISTSMENAVEVSNACSKIFPKCSVSRLDILR